MAKYLLQACYTAEGLKGLAKDKAPGGGPRWRKLCRRIKLRLKAAA